MSMYGGAWIVSPVSYRVVLGKSLDEKDSISMDEQYYKGIIAAYLGANFFYGPVDEWKIDAIKENISHYCETKIERSFLPRDEKEEQKHHMKQSLEVYIQGVKDELRRRGRMI